MSLAILMVDSGLGTSISEKIWGHRCSSWKLNAGQLSQSILLKNDLNKFLKIYLRGEESEIHKEMELLPVVMQKSSFALNAENTSRENQNTVCNYSCLPCVMWESLFSKRLCFHCKPFKLSLLGLYLFWCIYLDLSIRKCWYGSNLVWEQPCGCLVTFLKS